MPDGNLCPYARRNKAMAKFDLLCEILRALGSADADVRATAAARLGDLLVLLDLTWESVAYLIAKHGDRSAVAGAAALLP
jgi:hypothetical protein